MRDDGLHDGIGRYTIQEPEPQNELMQEWLKKLCILKHDLNTAAAESKGVKSIPAEVMAVLVKSILVLHTHTRAHTHRYVCVCVCVCGSSYREINNCVD